MKSADFQEILDDQLAVIGGVLSAKANEYATEDQLHNFKVAGQLQGITPKEALAGMMAKHTVSIFDMVSSEDEFPLTQWDEKITDHLNYLILLRACVIEEIQTRKKHA